MTALWFNYRLEHEKTEDQKKPVKPLKFPDDMTANTSGPHSAHHATNQKSLNLTSLTSGAQNSARTPLTNSKITPRQNFGGRSARASMQPLSGISNDNPGSGLR